MNVSFKYILADKIILTMLMASLILILLQGVFIALIFKNLPPFIPLFNQMPWGEERLATKTQIFIPIVLLVVSGLCNFIISSVTYKTIPLVSRFLAVTIFIISLLSLFLVFRTVFIII